MTEAKRSLPAYGPQLSGFEQVAERVEDQLAAELLKELRQLIAPGSPQHLLAQPFLSMTWLSVLAFGRKRAEP